MTIALLCPNGHRLICPEQQAGKRGKCPHCGATFRVPELSTAPVAGGSSPSLVSPSGSAPRNAPASLALEASGPGGGSAPSLLDIVEPPVPENPIKPYNDGDPVAESEIVFLCPEGHHLSGAASLGGKPGECPVCHTKFLVPSEEDLGEPEPPAASGPGLFNFDLTGPTNGEAEVASESKAPNRLAELFESFWAYKAHGAIVELHLDGGKTIAPDGYAPHLSHGEHGVFMLREASGLHTLAAVRWDSVSHVAVRGLREPPEGVFDEGH